MVEETRRVVRVKIPTLICRRCSKRWLPRTTEVRRCPACKSPDWNRPRPTRIQRLDCRRCGHAWKPRRAKRSMCPRCKSRRWETPKAKR